MDIVNSWTRGKTHTEEYDYIVMTVFGYGGENSDRSFVYSDFAKAIEDSHKYTAEGRRVQIKKRHEIVSDWETYNYTPPSV